MADVLVPAASISWRRIAGDRANRRSPAATPLQADERNADGRLLERGAEQLLAPLQCHPDLLAFRETSSATPMKNAGLPSASRNREVLL